jgi:NUBPL iron-transfer P-loop NTPase
VSEVEPVPPPTTAALRRKPDGTVITFYSYKGGVGRSMAVANIAWLLASEYGKRVVVVDWDLEAPGLHRFFGIKDAELGPGLIDYLTSYRDALREPERKFSESNVLITGYLQLVESFLNGGSLRLMSAGAQKDRASYVRKVRDFDWKGFYDNWSGTQLIEAMRTQFRQEADFTLVDSRTGLTDIGGICTVQMPDTVVFVFVFNAQNINGVATIASELHDPENKTLQALQRWPTLHFLSARKELSEQRNLRDWEKRADEMFGRFCDSPRIRQRYGTKTIEYLRALSIPYVPYFAYGEELPARTDLGLEIRSALQPLIELLLEEKAETAAAMAAKRGEETRTFLKKRLGVIGGLVSLLVLGVIGSGIYGLWEGYPVDKVLAALVGDSQLAQLAAQLSIGALCGAGGALTIVANELNTSALGPRRFWSRAAIQGLAGALIGVTAAAVFKKYDFFPLISFFASAGLPALIAAITSGIAATKRSNRSD